LTFGASIFTSLFRQITLILPFFFSHSSTLIFITDYPLEINRLVLAYFLILLDKIFMIPPIVDQGLGGFKASIRRMVALSTRTAGRNRFKT